VTEKYQLITRSRAAGFFSNFFWALNASISAQEADLIPILQLPMDSSYHSRGNKYSRPSWSRFFTVLDSSNSLSISESQKAFLGELTENAETRPLHVLTQKFWQVMPLRTAVTQKMDQEILEIGLIQQKRILGVHFRGKDMYWHPSHPTPPTQNQMVNLVLQLLNQHSFDGIFVATDTANFVARLRAKSPLPVMHFYSKDDGPESSGDDSSSVYKVIRDAWALSKCTSLLHSDSNVSSAARLFRGADYEDRIEIKLGSNPRNLALSLARYFWRSVIPDKLTMEKLELEIFKGIQN
jgi:hypothetical protein